MAYREVKNIKQYYEKQLNMSLCIPSVAHSYSLCIEYMKNWFITKFRPDFFKSVYVDGTHILDDYKSMSKLQMLRREKPSLTIIPSIDLTFDRETVDIQQTFGLDVFVNRAMGRNVFFDVPSNGTKIALIMQQYLIRFNFKVRVPTKAQQLDLYNFMKIAFGVGATQGENVDMDFHVPYDLMLQIAIDNGFKIEGRKIKNIREFVHFLNSHSSLPFLYKYRCINGNNEFFIKMREMYVHIASLSLEADDGERQGVVTSNYVVELETQVRFPAPQVYGYYSETRHQYLEYGKEVENCMLVYSIKSVPVPDTNEKGWLQFLSTVYIEDQNKMDKPLNIDLSEMFEGEMREIICDSLKTLISPSMFIEIRLYNDGELKPINIDWQTMHITTNEPVVDEQSYIVIYCDFGYLNDQITTIREMEKDRIN